MNNEIILTQQDGIATLRVNRPEARNALNWTAQEQFAAARRLAPPEMNQLETALFVDLWAEPDHLEALAAFRAKHSPTFGNRFSGDCAVK